MTLPPWLEARIERVRREITAFDVLATHGIDLPRGDREQQIPCPFHGDTKPSCRVFSDDSQQTSHAWCYVCNERWDSIKLYRKFHPELEGERFVQVLARMERDYRLPPLPDDAKPRPRKEATAFDRLLPVLETRIRYFAEDLPETEAKEVFSISDDLDRAIWVAEHEGHDAGLVVLKAVQDRLRI